jgi:hypothetical protein
MLLRLRHSEGKRNRDLQAGLKRVEAGPKHSGKRVFAGSDVFFKRE